MAKKLYEESNIQAIANALRGKCGTTCGYKTCDMAAAIESISTGGSDATIRLDAVMTLNNKNAGVVNRGVINLLGSNTLTLDAASLGDTASYGVCAELFYGDGDVANSPYITDATWNQIVLGNDFSVMLQNSTNTGRANRMFYNCKDITKCPDWVQYLAPTFVEGMFSACDNLVTIPEFKTNSMGLLTADNYNSASSHCSYMFENCYKLTSIPTSVLKGMKHQGHTFTNYRASFYYYAFYNCKSLTAINELGVETCFSTDSTYCNMFYETFRYCDALSSMTFETNNGSPIATDWHHQSINLYNTGTNYNHDSMVETINSLPDTSSGTGSNTIYFSSANGGSALTEEEIAVATARGWTVTLS